MIPNSIEVYTDGSCHTQLKTGAWAAILLIDGQEFATLKEVEENTTHNRMELLAVIKTVEYIKSNGFHFELISFFSDSQYVINLVHRKEKLERQNLLTKSGTPIRNIDLVQTFFQLLDQTPIQLTKVKAHQKATEAINYNRKVDILVRKMLRNALDKDE